MMMQAGFCLFESGLVRSKNNINVAFKNISDFALTALVYWMIGFGIMYGSSVAGVFGSSHFFFNPEGNNGAQFLFQLMFCGATATIVGGALAERTSFSSYLIISILIGAILYPIPGHWIWSNEGWLANLGFLDFAGGTVVHLLGGCLALVVAIIVGPRVGRFQNNESDDEEPRKINASSYPLATVGVILLWFGWFGFNTGSVVGQGYNFAQVAINTGLAASAGATTMIVWFVIKTGKPDILPVLNGTLAGLVGVTAGANMIATYDAVIIGITCAIFMNLGVMLLEKLHIDDVVSAFPVHAISGAIGTLMVALLGDTSFFADDVGRLQQFGIQLAGVLATVAWSLVAGYGLFFTLNKLVPMRVSLESELQGLNFSEHGATTEVQDLLSSMVAQQSDDDFTRPVDVEPHTEVGQIATEYNKVLDRIRLEIKTREEAYSRLKQASHFQYIFENSHEGIIQLAESGEVEIANAAAADLLGFASIDRMKKSVGPWLRDLDLIGEEAHKALMREFAERGSLINKDIVFNREVDSKRGYARFTMKLIDGNDEQEPCFLISFIDTGANLENEKLKVAASAAEAASKAKSQFLANMSHEIRTPLNGVTGMLELLSRTQLEDGQRRYIGIAQNSAKSLLSVINDILDFSKIEAGKLELDCVDFPLRETLADVVDIFASQAADKKVELIGRIPPDVPDWVIGDPERLRQVLINIMGNAIKFTDKGFISLTATCKKKTDSLAILTLEIADSGCGISQENIKKLFNSFTQADSSTTRKYGGTGLGLTISEQLIGLMKGRINVTSEIGKGSVFSIELPMPISKNDPIERGGLPASFSGMRVMVVDDHPVNLELTTELLVPFGLKIDSFDNATSAIKAHNKAASENNPYELYLLDYHMPSIDGAELARQIRATEDGKTGKLILLTSIDQVSAKDDGMDSFDTLLVKPVRASRLFDSIATVMADRLINETKGATAKAAEQTESTADALTPEITSNTRILIVEDNMVNQIVATEILEQVNLVSETAENGQEAIDKLSTGKFDLVLMDCQMPVLDGFEASRKIRQIEAENNVAKDQALPIIALTANALKGDRDRCIEAGMNDYITKPLDSEQLYGLLADYLKNGKRDTSNADNSLGGAFKKAS